MAQVWYDVYHSDHYHLCLCGCVCDFGLMFVSVWRDVYHTVIIITDVDHSLMCVWPCLRLWFDVCVCAWHQCGTMCISDHYH